MKKHLFLLLVLFISTTLSHAAIVNGTCGDNLTWSLNTKDSTLTIAGFGEMTSVPWSEHMSYIAHAYLPDGLTTIRVDAFNGCASLSSIEIPNSVTNIGKYAFGGCIGLTSIEIPNSVTSIGNYAFDRCTGLTSVSIPNSINGTLYGTFRRCTSLISVTIGNSVKRIGPMAFEDCSSLKTIEIPYSVTSIGNNAFQNCRGLTFIKIPNSVTSIGESAFYGCSSLKTISIGNGVANIENQAFSGCNLISVTCESSTPPAISNNTFTNYSVILFVPEESIEAYQKSLYWEEFTDIRAIGSAPLVQFLDWDGMVLSTAYVNIGSAATPPTDPTREGYTFIGWDKEFTNITEDLVVTAQYQINRFEVVFKDWDGTVLKSDSVDWNTAAIAPTNPSREGYTFIGWDKEFSQVTENMIITAQYELGENKTVTVIFANGNDESEILSQQLTMKVPSAPSISGFTFVRWQAYADDIKDGITIQSVYQADIPSSAPEIVTNPSNPAQKLIRNGNVYILTDSKTYTVTGQEVR